MQNTHCINYLLTTLYPRQKFNNNNNNSLEFVQYNHQQDQMYVLFELCTFINFLLE
jgi:hypothetical protein